MTVRRIRALVATFAAATLGMGLLSVGAAVGAADQAGLAAVGPVSGSNGFPVWYEDKTGVRVGLCLDGTDPLCGFLPGDIPNANLPITFPDNFPEEAFYMLAGAGVTMDNGGAATLTLGLEGAFSTAVQAGDQMVFGRVRVKVTDAQPDAYYVVFHPYGTDVVQAEPSGRLFVTEDVGLTPGEFTGALSSRIGPFLSWGADAPAGYLGDPNIEHTVTGSPVTDINGAPQNYFKVVGPLTEAPADPAALANEAAPSTDLFGLQGKLATDRGVTGVAAYYTRGDAGTGSGDVIDVFARSDAGQAIDVQGQPDLGFGTTLMAGGESSQRYHARVPLTGAPPASVTVVNVGDSEPAPVDIPVTDAVTVTRADFDADADTLLVEAVSSDPLATLHVPGFGDLVSGSGLFTGVDAAPGVVRVDSSAGGTDSAPPTTIGTPFATLAPLVSAGGDFSIPQGTEFTLKAALVQGDASQFLWERVDVDPVEFVGGTKNSTYIAPAADSLTGPMAFRVTATGPGGTDSDEVLVTVNGIQDPVANAGADQVATRGTAVTLDGTASTDAVSYSWVQVSGPPVTLNGAGTANPTFTFPRYDAAVFADPTAPVVVELTVAGLDGTTPSTDTVAISPGPADVLTVTAAQYRRGKREWRIDGTSSILAGQTIKVHLGTSVVGTPVIGTAAVDGVGAWRIRITNSTAVPPAGVTSQPISVESQRGGVLQGAQAFNATVGN